MSWLRRVAAGCLAAVALVACQSAEATPPARLSVTIGPTKVGGEVLLPANTYQPPAVVMLTGAGPNDRDETTGMIKPYRDIAEGLAAKGVASLRFDKRTVRREPVGPAFTVREEYIEDALDAFARLRSSGRVDPNRIFLLGHSFGGAIAPRIAAVQPEVAGLILLAAPARSLPETLLGQFRYLTTLGGTLADGARTQVPLAEDLVRQSSSATLQTNEPIRSAVARDTIAPGLTGAYFLDLRRFSPLRAAQAVTQPVLLLEAGRDFLVFHDDLLRWADAFRAAKTVTARTFPLANHAFVNGTGEPTPQEYQRPGRVSSAVIEEIAEWILGN